MIIVYAIVAEGTVTGSHKDPSYHYLELATDGDGCVPGVPLPLFTTELLANIYLKYHSNLRHRKVVPLTVI